MNNKYVILPGNTDLNRGDQALIWESVELCKFSGLTGQYYLLECGLNEEEVHKQSWQTKKKGYNFIAPVLLHPGRGKKHGSKNESYMYSKTQIITWGLRAAIDLISSMALLSKLKIINKIGLKMINEQQRESYKTISEANAVILKGGGLLHSYGKITDIYYIYYSLYHLLLAERLNIPVIVMPNSYGPFKGKIVNILLKKALGNAKIVTSREGISREVLREFTNVNSEIYPDLGFFLKNSNKFNAKKYLLKKGVPIGDKKCIGMTLRPYRFPKSDNPKEKYENYISSIAKYIKWLEENNYFLVMVAHTLGPSAHEDDRIAIKDVLNKCTSKNIVYIEDENLDCEDIKSLYSELDFVIGTRFHSAIFAMASGVPSIAISYGGNKGEGIMKDMGLEKYVVPIEEINYDSLVEKTIDLDNNSDQIKLKINNYIIYAESLKNKLSEAIRKEIIK